MACGINRVRPNAKPEATYNTQAGRPTDDCPYMQKGVRRGQSTARSANNDLSANRVQYLNKNMRRRLRRIAIAIVAVVSSWPQMAAAAVMQAVGRRREARLVHQLSGLFQEGLAVPLEEISMSLPLAVTLACRRRPAAAALPGQAAGMQVHVQRLVVLPLQLLQVRSVGWVDAVEQVHEEVGGPRVRSMSRQDFLTPWLDVAGAVEAQLHVVTWRTRCYMNAICACLQHPPPAPLPVLGILAPCKKTQNGESKR